MSLWVRSGWSNWSAETKRQDFSRVDQKASKGRVPRKLAVYTKFYRAWQEFLDVRTSRLRNWRRKPRSWSDVDFWITLEPLRKYAEREEESFLLQCSNCLRCFSATKGRVNRLMMFLGRGCSWWPSGKEETVGASDNARQIKDLECRRKEGAFMFVAWCTARHRFCNSSGLVSIICRNWSSTSWSGAKSENSSKSSQLQP
jgi:hypothetical protein